MQQQQFQTPSKQYAAQGYPARTPRTENRNHATARHAKEATTAAIDEAKPKIFRTLPAFLDKRGRLTDRRQATVAIVRAVTSTAELDKLSSSNHKGTAKYAGGVLQGYIKNFCAKYLPEIETAEVIKMRREWLAEQAAKEVSEVAAKAAGGADGNANTDA